MPRIINLDAVLRDTIEINKKMGDGSVRTYTLYDDIPDIIGLMMFKVIDIESRIPKTKPPVDVASADAAPTTADGASEEAELSETSIEETVEAWRAFENAIDHTCGEIFRHSYPGVTDGELRETFSFTERRDLVKLFFTMVLARLKQRRDGSAPMTDLERQIQEQMERMQEKPASPNGSHPVVTRQRRR